MKPGENMRLEIYFLIATKINNIENTEKLQQREVGHRRRPI